MFWTFILLASICTALIRLSALSVWVTVIESNIGTGRCIRSVVFLAKVTAHFQPSYMKSTLEKYYDHYPARRQPTMPRLQ